MKRLLLIAAFFMALAPVAPANAHTTLVGSNPPTGAIISTWPHQLTLTFGEPLEIITGQEINFVTVHNAQGDDLLAGAPQVSSTVITVPVKANSVPGLVLVNYRVAAADGHVLDGEYTFSFQRSGGTTSANPTASTSHHGNKNTAVYSATTVLIVSALLAGVWIYRRRKP